MADGIFPHLFAFPDTFIVYFSPTQVTFVSNPTENPTWYPIENDKAMNNNTNTKVSKKSMNLLKESQNFSMAPSFFGARLFHFPPFCL